MLGTAVVSETAAVQAWCLRLCVVQREADSLADGASVRLEKAQQDRVLGAWGPFAVAVVPQKVVLVADPDRQKEPSSETYSSRTNSLKDACLPV